MDYALRRMVNSLRQTKKLKAGTANDVAREIGVLE
jgi:hypothetical protein